MLKILGGVIFACFIQAVVGEDVYTINTKKSVRVVDEKFISIVIDPFLLISGLNISAPTLELARHLSPALVRLHGPSSANIVFSSDPETQGRAAQRKLIVSPNMWRSVNEWIVRANLTPVFALSDGDRVNEAWNPKLAMSLMELTDKMNISCYWELGNDATNKTLRQYADDVVALGNIQDAFPASRGNWKTVGGDLNVCSGAEAADVRRLLNELQSRVDAVNWKPDSFPRMDQVTKAALRHRVPVWLTAPRNPAPTTFLDGLLWAKYLGEAARLGYDVVFRQPKIRELFQITPSFWISMLHKSLMGRNVLDVRSTKPDGYVYAHCTKCQNRYTRRGAVTVLMVNAGDEELTAQLKILGTQIKNMEIRSYILTSPHENSTDTILNNVLLSATDLQENKIEFVPKVCRAKPSKYLTLNLAPKSIGFFVLPGAQALACIHGEKELDLIRKEISDDQKEMVPEFRLAEDKGEPLTDMNKLYKMMEDELRSNERYYKKLDDKKNEWRTQLIEKAQLVERAQAEKEKINHEQRSKITEDLKRLIIDRARLAEKQKQLMESEQRRNDLKHLLSQRADKQDLELKLGGKELGKVPERKDEGERKVSLSNQEIEELIRKATEKLYQDEARKSIRKRRQPTYSANMIGKRNLYKKLYNTLRYKRDTHSTPAPDRRAGTSELLAGLDIPHGLIHNLRNSTSEASELEDLCPCEECAKARHDLAKYDTSKTDSGSFETLFDVSTDSGGESGPEVDEKIVKGESAKTDSAERKELRKSKDMLAAFHFDAENFSKSQEECLCKHGKGKGDVAATMRAKRDVDSEIWKAKKEQIKKQLLLDHEEYKERVRKSRKALDDIRKEMSKIKRNVDSSHTNAYPTQFADDKQMEDRFNAIVKTNFEKPDILSFPRIEADKALTVVIPLKNIDETPAEPLSKRMDNTIPKEDDATPDKRKMGFQIKMLKQRYNWRRRLDERRDKLRMMNRMKPNYPHDNLLPVYYRKKRSVSKIDKLRRRKFRRRFQAKKRDTENVLRSKRMLPKARSSKDPDDALLNTIARDSYISNFIDDYRIAPEKWTTITTRGKPKTTRASKQNGPSAESQVVEHLFKKFSNLVGTFHKTILDYVNYLMH